MKKIAIFIPLYNEAETLERLLENVPRKILGWETEITVVDDCSTDATADIAKKFTPKVIKLYKNYGVGVVTKKGLESIAGGDYEFVIKFDGDGQHDLGLLPQVVVKLIEGNDLVICSRFHPLSDQSHTPIDRVLLNTIFTEMVRKITGWEITDVRSGYMGFRFNVIQQIANQIIIERYGVPMELILRTWSINRQAKVVEIPHPALYGNNISAKLSQKYSAERVTEKATRLEEAYAALLAIIEDLGISREEILEMNGFSQYLAQGE